MSTVTLPTRTDQARYDFELELEGVVYRFLFDWNERDQAWQFSIFDADNVLILAGARVVVNYPIFGRLRDPRLPPGDLSAVDTSGQGIDPGFADLGSRVQLIYVPITDFDPVFLQPT